MAGTLHIFRRSVVNGTPHYQVNYNTAGNSFARVFETETGLTDFLIQTGALEEDEVNNFWDSVVTDGHATIADVHIQEPEASQFGMRQAPSDE